MHPFAVLLIQIAEDVAKVLLDLERENNLPSQFEYPLIMEV
ncbi:MAG: hypothetical protein WCO29_19170 [Nostocales cyanobacterium ELA583]|jgi:hypothetical protein